MTGNLLGAVAAGLPLTMHPVWPFIIALGSAVAFGLSGPRVGEARLFRAIGGGVFGLVVSAIASGLANAITVPYTAPAINLHQFIAIVAAVVMITFVGLLAGLLKVSASVTRRLVTRINKSR